MTVCCLFRLKQQQQNSGVNEQINKEMFDSCALQMAEFRVCQEAKEGERQEKQKSKI